ncbi:MAG: Crp/Fnr family transcriptional regulator [Alphaproteobacteria bacterium]
MSGPKEKSGKIFVDCPACGARRSGLCEGCCPETLQTIARFKSGDREIKTGHDVFSPGDPCDSIYNLVSGWVFLYNLLEDGRRQILHFALPGAVLGFNPTQGALATYGAEALTDSIVCVIPHGELGALSKEFPEIGMRLARLSSRDSILAYDQMTSIGRLSARERVAHLILELFIRYRMQWPGHQIEEMYLPLTQEHIGDATGLTGVHVNRVLSGLRKQGIAEFHYKRLRILDPDKLADIAGLDPEVMASWTRRCLAT